MSVSPWDLDVCIDSRLSMSQKWLSFIRMDVHTSMPCSRPRSTIAAYGSSPRSSIARRFSVSRIDLTVPYTLPTVSPTTGMFSESHVASCVPMHQNSASTWVSARGAYTFSKNCSIVCGYSE